jgi:hypothetical protein
MYSIANETVEVPEDIQELPDLPGFGVIYSLRQAMARDETGNIREALEAYLSANEADKPALLNQLLFVWAGVDGVDPASRGGNPNPNAAPILLNMYNSMILLLHTSMDSIRLICTLR